MAEISSIEWTDATWNPITGCSVHGPGCKNCYAMRLAGTRMKDHPSRKGLTVDTEAGPVWNGQVRLNEAWLGQPLSWKRPRKIFVGAHTDLFQEAVTDEMLDLVFHAMRMAPWHHYQLLTKRPERAFLYLFARQIPMGNVLIGASVEDQKRADDRCYPMEAICDLGWRTWVSYEPALGMVDWTGWDFISWLVSGGESGPNARPTHPEWHRAARDWCLSNGVPFLFKQWGEWHADALMFKQAGTGLCPPPDMKIGKKTAGRLLDGVEHNGYPR